MPRVFGGPSRGQPQQARVWDLEGGERQGFGDLGGLIFGLGRAIGILGQGMKPGLGLEEGLSLLRLAGFWLVRLAARMGFWGLALALLSNFLVREWESSGCGGWVYCFVVLSFFFLGLLFFSALSLGRPGFLSSFFWRPFWLLIGRGCC